jgi:hypothetical protein
MGGLTVPMVEKGRPGRGVGKNGVRVRKAVREDFVVTEYPDGSNDTAVFAPSVRVETRF